MKHLLAIAILAACGSSTVDAPHTMRDQARRTELGAFMKSQVNPPFSRLSFLLFHNDADGDVDASQLPTTAAALSRAATALANWTDAPVESEQGKSVFFDYALTLKTDATALESAVRANRKDAAIAAFELLRKKCDSCHHFFRFDESSSR